MNTNRPARGKDLCGDGLMTRRRFTIGGSALLASLAAVILVLAVSPAATAAAQITLTPASATNIVGQMHCVTATVTGANAPGFDVEFTTSGTAAPVPDSAVVGADANGQAQFCFTSALPGDVLIKAVARGTNTQSRPTAYATKTFVLGPTDKDQCKQGGWQNYPQFKNQGDCVSFVATDGKNPPAN